MRQPASTHAIEFVVDLASLHQTAGGSVVGRLELVAGEVRFPGSGWTDFVVVVLGWFLDALPRVFAGERVVVSLMDGPFEIGMECDGTDLVAVGSERRRHGTVQVFRDQSPADAWKTAALAAAEALANDGTLVGQGPVADRDLQVLVEAASRLRSADLPQ